MRKVIGIKEAGIIVNKLLMLGRLIKDLEIRLKTERGNIAIWTELYDLRQRRNGIIEGLR